MPRLVIPTGPIAAGKNAVADKLVERLTGCGETVVVADVDDVSGMVAAPGAAEAGLWFAAHEAHDALVGQWMRSSAFSAEADAAWNGRVVVVDVGVMTDVRPTADRAHAPNCGAAVRRSGAPGRYGRRMETARPSQSPSWLLVVVMFLLGICALPAALFFVLSGIAGDSGSSPFLVLGLGVPALAAYPVAVWLCLRARRVGSTGRAWLLAALGLLLVVGTSTLPVALLGGAFVEEWRETQPGGRGYQAPDGSR